VTLQIAAVVTLRIKATRRKGYVRFSGLVEPTEVGAPIVVQWLKPAVAQPATVATTTVRKGSRFSVVAALKHGGHFNALVQLPANGAQASGVSDTVSLRVTRARKP
jgi:hypothetical protein